MSYYGRINPCPELILPGKWRKASGSQHYADLSSLQLEVPSDASDESVAVRTHEYGHIRYSPISRSTDLTPLEDTLVLALEDNRINELTTRAGLDVSAIGNIDLGDEVLSKPLNHIVLYLSSKHYKGKACDKIYKKPLNPYVRDLLEQSIANVTETLSYDTVIEEAKKLAKIFTGGGSGGESGEGGSPEGSSSGEPTGTEPTGLEGKSKKPEDGKSGTKQPIDIPEKFKMKFEDKSDSSLSKIQTESAESDTRVPHGRAKIVKAPMVSVTKKLNIHRASGRKAGYDGMVIRHPERVLTDKRVFSVRSKKGICTVLIDYSGSMGLQPYHIEEILKHMNGATIAIYHGRTDEDGEGEVRVVAEKGRVAKILPRTMVGNVVDYDALKWLKKQRGPYIWVCDGGVTGVHDGSDHQLRTDCAMLAMQIKAVRFHRLEDLLKAIKNGKLPDILMKGKQFARKYYAESNPFVYLNSVVYK